MKKIPATYKIFNKADIDNPFTAKEYDEMREAMQQQVKNARIPLLVYRDDTFETYKGFIDRITKEMAAHTRVKLYTSVGLKTLKIMAQDGCLLLNYYDENGNLIIGNKRQRNEVTTDAWKSNLFLSVITGTLMDTPTLYLTRNGVTTADGNQRLTALVKILTNKIKITGTGTNLDGWHFSELDADLQEAILNVEIDIMVIHPNLATDNFLNKVFADMNGKQNKATKTEELIATHDTEFRSQIQNLVNGEKRGRYASAVKRVIGTSQARNRRMRDIEGILYAQAIVEGETPSNHGDAVETMLQKYPDTKTGIKDGTAVVRNITRTCIAMHNIFGAGCTCSAERDNGVELYYSNPDKNNPLEYSKFTNSVRLRRSSNVSSKYFISLFYTTGLMLKHAGLDACGKGFQFHPEFGDAMRGMLDKIIVLPEFDKAMNGGPGDLSRSRRLAKTLVYGIITSNQPICHDPILDQMVRQNWQECILDGDLRHKSTQVFAWR